MGRIASVDLLAMFSCDAAQDVVGFLGCKGTLPAHVKLLVNQHLQGCCQLILVPACICTWDCFQSPSGWQGPFLPVVSCTRRVVGGDKLAEGALSPTVHVAYKDVKWHLS